MVIFKNLNELIFPTRCIGCRVLGLSLCVSCRRDWNPHHYQSLIGNIHGHSIKVTSSVKYSSVAQKVILAAKESQIRSADILVADAIRHSIENVLREEFIDSFIPIPSRKSAVRLRGREFIREMTEIAVKDMSIPVAPILRHSRNVRDQSGLNGGQRWNNLEGSLVVEEKQRSCGRVLLIDDLVTTGATLSEAARALRYAGIEVIGAVTAALAQPVR